MNPPISAQFPTFQKAGAVLVSMAHRLARFFFSRTSLKCYLIIASLICLTYTTLRWVGRRALQVEKERVAALGMATDWKQLITPMPPDEDNFLAAPPFAGLFSAPQSEAPELAMWLGFKNNNATTSKNGDKVMIPRPKQDTLEEWCAYFRKIDALPAKSTPSSPAEELIGDQRWQSTIQSVYAAAKRPESHFQNVDPTQNLTVPGNNRAIWDLLRSLQLYARAHLQSGSLDQALPAFQVIHHLARAVALEPYSHAAMSASIILELQRPMLLEAIILHRLPPIFLKDLLREDYQTPLLRASQRGFALDLLDRLFKMEHAEKWIPALQDSSFEEWIRWQAIPDYHFTKLAIGHCRFQSELFLAARPLQENEDWLSRRNSLIRPWSLNFGPIGVSPDPNQQNEFGWKPLVPIARACIRQIVIALEIHYLENQRYPKNLEVLRSTLPIQTRTDIDGQPFRYVTNEAGSHFTLLSVGQDGVVDAADQRWKNDLVFSTEPKPISK